MISDLIRRMADLGAPMEAILIAVEAIEERDRAEIDRKAKRAAQKRRERDKGATVARQSLDKDATVDATVAPKEKSPHTPLKENPISEANASDAGASPSPPVVSSEARAPSPPPQPCSEAPPQAEREEFIPPPSVYASAKHELWAEGRIMLAELGISKSQAGSIMGRWMKDARDDAAGVLDAIRRARDAKPVDPIAWITRAITPAEKPNEPDRSASAAARRLQASLASLGDAPTITLSASDSGRQDQNFDRLLPQGRG